MHVGESDFYMDLLFYHVRLHCYVVVELKTEKFKPEFAGKLNFYVTAVNKQMKTKKDNPTIGILICKDKDDVVAEYALDDISQLIGIVEYELTTLTAYWLFFLFRNFLQFKFCAYCYDISRQEHCQ